MEASKCIAAVKENIGRVMIGSASVIDLLLTAMIADGHVLIEDVPGMGKTVLAKSLAKSVSARFSRIQFTPDLLPSDVTGLNYFNQKENEFIFSPGPAFCNILLADEINRATPRTQSSLLECMGERQITVDGETMQLEAPFFVIATQNPIETLGTYPLPEAQLDRFLMKGRMEYPSFEESVDIIERFERENPLDLIKPVTDTAEVVWAIRAVEEIYLCRDLMEYIVKIVEATRAYPRVVLGVSPRGALALARAAKGYAAISGRNFVLPDDIKRAAHPVLEHRLIFESAARIKRDAAKTAIDDIVSSVSVPTEAVFESAGL